MVKKKENFVRKNGSIFFPNAQKKANYFYTKFDPRWWSIMTSLQHCLKFLPLSLIKLCVEYAQFFDVEGIAVGFEFENNCVFNKTTGQSFFLGSFIHRVFFMSHNISFIACLNLMDRFFLRSGFFVGPRYTIDLNRGYATTTFETLFQRKKNNWTHVPKLTYGINYVGGLCDSKESFLSLNNGVSYLSIGNNVYEIDRCPSPSPRPLFWRNAILLVRKAAVYSFSPNTGYKLLTRLSDVDNERQPIRQMFVLSESSFTCLSYDWVLYYRNNEVAWELGLLRELEKLLSCSQMWETNDGRFICKIQNELFILEREKDRLLLKKWKDAYFTMQLDDGSLVTFEKRTKTHHKLISY